MAQIWRVVADWSGGRVGTGYSNLFFTQGTSTAQACADAVKAFFSGCYSVGAMLPTGVTIGFRSTVDVLEATNGELTSTVSVSAPTTINGSDNGAYAGVAGGCVTWRTGDFVGGHRVRGRTFLVPAGATGLQSDGTLSAVFKSALETAATTLISAAPEFVIWRRPTNHAAADGSSHIVGTGAVADKTAFLTSRR